jgi:thiol-disulfide isomerase/thioredoxin
MNLSLVIACALLGTTIVLGSTEEPLRYAWGAPHALGPELLIDGVKKNKGNTNELLANVNTIALYFSAHWCPPCQQFTPILKKLYEQSWKSNLFL